MSLLQVHLWLRLLLTAFLKATSLCGGLQLICLTFSPAPAFHSSLPAAKCKPAKCKHLELCVPLSTQVCTCPVSFPATPFPTTWKWSFCGGWELRLWIQILTWPYSVCVLGKVILFFSALRIIWGMIIILNSRGELMRSIISNSWGWLNASHSTWNARGTLQVLAAIITVNFLFLFWLLPV